MNEFYYTYSKSFYISDVIFPELFSPDFDQKYRVNALISDMQKDYPGYSFPCFGRFQRGLREKHRYDLESEILLKDTEILIGISRNSEKTVHYGQLSLMSRDDLDSHINFAKQLISGFTYSVTKETGRSPRSEKFLVVDLKLEANNINYRQIRFLLTWLRYSYEWAINVSTLDAYRLLKNPEYIPKLKGLDILNLTTITSKLMRGYILWDQTIGWAGSKPTNLDVIKERLSMVKEEDTYRILNQRVFDNILEPDSIIGESLPMLTSSKTIVLSDYRHLLSSDKLYSYNWWASDESFEKIRLPYYCETVNKLIENFNVKI